MDRNAIVDAIAFGGLALALSLVAFGIYIATRIVRSAKGEDRRRYLLAALAMIGPPIVFAAVARSLVWIYFQSGYAMSGPDEGLLFLGNLLPAMACSAAAAFVLPFRSPRERGFAVVGGAVVGFAVYCMFAGL